MTAFDVIGLIVLGALGIGFLKLILGIKAVPAPNQPHADGNSGRDVTGAGRRELRSPVPPARPEPSATPDECWVRPGVSVTVAGRALTGGMIYIGRGLTTVAGQSIEPALVDPTLPVSRAGPSSYPAAMSYWPAYNSIAPEGRATYLDWLASGRRAPSTDIGYVFLYFYGLERRVLAEATRSDGAAAELTAIQLELEELLRVYAANGITLVINDISTGPVL